MNRGIFFMLTATEVQHLKDVIQGLSNVLFIEGEEGPSGEEINQALEILNKIKPLDTEEVLTATAKDRV